MTRHSLALTILALTGLVLALPEPSLARAPSFRPAFTGGPFRIVVPAGRMHGHGHGPRVGRPAATLPARVALPATAHPVTHTVGLGAAPFRKHHRGHGGAYYPAGGYGSYYGSPYDPSDIPVYGPIAATDEALAPVLMPPRLPVATPERGCRAQQVTVPNASGAGESGITIVRC